MTTEQLVLKALNNILENTKNTDNKKTFTLVDEFMGQYEDEDGNPLWSCPSALVELVDILWDDEAYRNLQTGTLRFRIHFVDDIGYDDKKRRLNTNHNTNMAGGLKALRQKQVKLNDVGINLTDTLMNRITRKRTEFVNTLAETVVTIVEFESTIVDYSMLPVWTEITAQFNTQYYLVENELDFLNKIG